MFLNVAYWCCLVEIILVFTNPSVGSQWVLQFFDQSKRVRKFSLRLAPSIENIFVHSIIVTGGKNFTYLSPTPIDCEMLR
jgi:hypothetical protein